MDNIDKEIIERLYNFVETRGYKVKAFKKGETSPVIPNDAEILKFNKSKNGNDSRDDVYIYLSLDDNKKELNVFYNTDMTDRDLSSEEDEFINNFIPDLSAWAKSENLRFSPADLSKAQTTIQQRKSIREGYYPITKQSSYNDSIPTTRIIIQHSKKIEEGEKRYFNIEKIFVENTKGERFLIDTKKPGIAKVYARHIAEGGSPYDERGKHITSIVEEYKKMSGFLRAVKNKQFNESAQQLVMDGMSHYQKIRETLHKLRTKRGYDNYFENYIPNMEESTDDEILNELFVQQILDERIKEALPILMKLNKHSNKISEVTQLENWSDNIVNELSGLDPDPLKGAFDLEQEVFLKNQNTTETPYKITSVQGTNLTLTRPGESPKVVPASNVQKQEQNQQGIQEQSSLSKDEIIKKILGKLDDDIFSKHGDEFVSNMVEKFVNKNFEKLTKHLNLDKIHSMIKNKLEKPLTEKLGPEQIRVGQLGPTEKVGKKGAVGKLVGASESIHRKSRTDMMINEQKTNITENTDKDLIDIIRLSGTRKTLKEDRDFFSPTKEQNEYENIKTQIEKEFIDRAKEGQSDEEILSAKEEIADKLGYEADNSLFRDAWRMCDQKLTLGDISDIEDSRTSRDYLGDYTDDSMRRGEMGQLEEADMDSNLKQDIYNALIQIYDEGSDDETVNDLKSRVAKQLDVDSSDMEFDKVYMDTLTDFLIDSDYGRDVKSLPSYSLSKTQMTEVENKDDSEPPFIPDRTSEYPKTDKSGAVHTPASRASHLARQAAQRQAELAAEKEQENKG